MEGAPLFDRLRSECPDFTRLMNGKICLIEGDLDRDGFGLGEVRTKTYEDRYSGRCQILDFCDPMRICFSTNTLMDS